MTAFETRYDVSTHVLSSWLTERFPAMCGRDTFAMLVSSTSMNVAIVTTSAIAHGLWPPVQPVAKYAGRSWGGSVAAVIRALPWAPRTSRRGGGPFRVVPGRA